MAVREVVLEVYHRMLDRYGPQQWWPAQSRFEMMVGAVLTQSAAWSNVERAIGNLKAAGALSPSAIRGLGHQELARLVYPSGYYNAKARKLKALADYLDQTYADDLAVMKCADLAPLRAEMLDVYGLGEETVDDILLYALGKPVFVIDGYTRRVFHRLGLAPDKAPYSAYGALFTDSLPQDPDLFGEYHALIVAHGKDVCRRKPLCEGCCLLEICPTGQRTSS